LGTVDIRLPEMMDTQHVWRHDRGHQYCNKLFFLGNVTDTSDTAAASHNFARYQQILTIAHILHTPKLAA